VLLGTLFNVNALPVNALWAIAASWMTKNSGVSRGLKWLDRAAGAMFVGFGLKLALSDNPTT
jgi:threonine/homoserine/homoserine lactone efflux protein